MAALRSAYLPAAARVSTISLVAASSSAAVGWRVGATLLCAWAGWPAVDPDRSTEAAQPAMSPETTIMASAPVRMPRRTHRPYGSVVYEIGRASCRERV